MSIVLNGSTQYAWRAAPVADAAPFTVAAWFKSTSDSALQAIWGEAKQSDVYNFWRLSARGNAGGDPVGCYIRGLGAADATTSTGYTANTWHHAIFVEGSASDHRVYIDGGSEGSSVINQVPSNEDKMSVGVLAYNGSWANFFAGKLAEIAIWNIALSASDRTSLASGIYPSCIQAGNLVAYWPLLDDAGDDGGSSLDLTTVGSPSFDTGDHPTMGMGNSIVVNGTPAVDNTFYELGEVEITSGNNSGQKRPISLDASNVITTFWPFVSAIQSGDDYKLYPGCDLRGVTCDQKFNNVTKFRGFLYVPKIQDTIM